MDLQEIQVVYVSYLQLYALLDTSQMETAIASPFQFKLSAQPVMKVMEMDSAY
jgi:hypothetical protein